jgi:hypothetical protein
MSGARHRDADKDIVAEADLAFGWCARRAKKRGEQAIA